MWLRYDNLMMRRTLERDFPNFRWCIGPGCTFGQEHPDSPTDQPIIVCSACGFISCSQHNVPWHSGQKCEEFEKTRLARRSKEEKKTEKIIKSIAKRCPGCRRFINKNGGCNHMNCKCAFMKQRRSGCADKIHCRFVREEFLLGLSTCVSRAYMGLFEDELVEIDL